MWSHSFSPALLPPPGLPGHRQAEALRKELSMVKDKAKAYISRLNEVCTPAFVRRRARISLTQLAFFFLAIK